MEYTVGTEVFSGWKIVELLGEGASGKVFRLEKNEYGVVTRSALKVIRVPQNESEVNYVASEGMDRKSITTYFSSLVDEIVKEIAIMSELKYHPNIVQYEDHCVIEHKDDIGWDILIRMELLTPLMEYQKNHLMDESQVLKLGKDIAGVLAFCQKKQLIHRDVKPQNVMVDPMGNFKLGDFGVARTMEKTAGGLSQKGTVSYMAPEIYLGKAYGPSVDIYSLGLMLYRYMNDNRMPFFPPANQPIYYSDRENALNRRMNGETLPPPANGSRKLKNVILKACAYNPADRYHSAEEMQEALKKIPEPVKHKQESEEEEYDKTVLMFDNQRSESGAERENENLVSANETPKKSEQENEKLLSANEDSQTNGQKKEKNSKKKVLYGILACAVVGIGAFIGAENAGWLKGTPDDSEITSTPEPTATPTPELTATPTPEPTATPTLEPTATPTLEWISSHNEAAYKAYEDIIREYKDAKKARFSSVNANYSAYPNVLDWLVEKDHLFYDFYDIDKNGTEEMVIAWNSMSFEDSTPMVVDVFTFDGVSVNSFRDSVSGECLLNAIYQDGGIRCTVYDAYGYTVCLALAEDGYTWKKLYKGSRKFWSEGRAAKVRAETNYYFSYKNEVKDWEWKEIKSD